MIPLLILGLLKQHPGAHGYELLTLMEERHYKYVVTFTKGSFYYNLQQLAEKGLIKEVPTKAASTNHEANHFVITDSGQERFEELMRTYGTKTEHITQPFYSTMLFRDDYAPTDFQANLLIQIQETEKRIKLLVNSIEQQPALPFYFRQLLENARDHHQVNLEWYHSLLT